VDDLQVVFVIGFRHGRRKVVGISFPQHALLREMSKIPPQGFVASTIAMVQIFGEKIASFHEIKELSERFCFRSD
jgi:hypothetical protein